MNQPLKILTALVLCYLAILKSEAVFACICDGESTVKGAVQRADIIFKGKVISKTVASNGSLYDVKIEGDTASSALY